MGRALANDPALGRIKLSEREKEVLVAWSQTESKELVAKRLFTAPTKSALLARAIEDGILSLNDL